MNDDELIERLRRTLHAEADAIRPGDGARRVTRLDERRRRRPLAPVAAAALGVAALVAVAVLVAVHVAGHGRTQVVVSSGPPPAHISQPLPRMLPVATTTAPSTPATPGVPAHRASNVGADFDPGSVSFDTADQGWVLGIASCSAGPCLEVARTDDGGATWSALPGPDATVSFAAVDTFQIRFATAVDGWIFGNVGSNPEVWATHDGGGSWTAVALPGLGAGATLSDIEAAGGVVHAVGIASSGSIVVDDSPVATDDWTQSPISLSVGGGPVPSISLTLQGDGGWILVDNRTVVDGAQLDSAGQWTAWSPPCINANGPAVLAASTQPDLAATCNWGQEGAAARAPHTGEHLELSTNGGRSFALAGTVPSVLVQLASPAAGTVIGVTNDQSGLLATFDAGGSWQQVLAVSASHLVQVGFENGTQGVAIAQSTSGATGQLFMTRDGGHTWSGVDLHA